jgi:hypothetical protein
MRLTVHFVTGALVTDLGTPRLIACTERISSRNPVTYVLFEAWSKGSINVPLHFLMHVLLHFPLQKPLARY